MVLWCTRLSGPLSKLESVALLLAVSLSCANITYKQGKKARGQHHDTSEVFVGRMVQEQTTT